MSSPVGGTLREKSAAGGRHGLDSPNPYPITPAIGVA